MPRLLLVLHALSAMALLGSSTHLAVMVVMWLRGAQLPRRARLHSLIAGLLFLSTLALGALAYPSYRYLVAGLYLNRFSPWASNLFDLKETVAVFAAPLALGVALLGRRLESDQPLVRRAFALCALALCGLVAFAVICGLVVTSEKGL